MRLFISFAYGRFVFVDVLESVLIFHELLIVLLVD